ncbi:MAG: glutathione-disulfide reductase [Polyangiaceae bacterium]
MDFDLFVIGAGSAGVRASRVAAQLGARVGVAESGAFGGTCVNVGCVPKKLLVSGAHFIDEWRDASGFGWRMDRPTHDWSALIANKNREIQRLNGIYEKLLVDRGVRVFRARATIRGPHEVALTSSAGEEVIRAQSILIAVGGEPARPLFPGSEHVQLSDDMFYLERRPERVLVLGGGYIAVEFAGIFEGFGSHVTLAHRGPLFLRGFDRAVRDHLADAMRGRGIDLRFRETVTSIQKTADGARRVTFASGAELEVDAVLAAIGRVPRTAHLGLAAVGVETDPIGAVIVDGAFRTSVPSIYAVGDVIARIQLTPVALAEGAMLARSLFADDAPAPDYRDVPSAVFSAPPIATVGLTEEQARDELGEVDIYQSKFLPLKLTMSERKERTLMKLVVDRRTGRVVGVHMIGADAPEIIQGFAVALKCGATKRDFDRTIGIHPTAAEELVTMREPIAPVPVEPLDEEPAGRRVNRR